MDKVDTFQIQLDLADREVIYDYAGKEEFRRPSSGAWDTAVFRGHGSVNAIPRDDENNLMRIKLMDKMIMDTRCLEKKIKPKADSAEGASEKSSVKDAYGDYVYDDPDMENANLPVRLLPVYHQGEVVRGSVFLKLKESFAAEDLTISFVGQSVMNVRTYNGKTCYDDTRHDKHFERETVLWKKASGNGSSASKMADTFNLMSLSSEPAVSQELGAGEHKFYFEFVLPSNAPQSVPPMYISTVNYAHLVWRLKAKINTNTFLNRKNVACHKGILVENPSDIGRRQELLQPINAEEDLDTGLLWSSGNIFCKASLAKAGHVKGKAVAVTVEIHNNTSSDINQVTAFVHLHGKAKMTMIWPLKINFKSTKISAGPIKAGTNETYRWILPWDFSESSADGRLLPVGHLEEAQMFDVKYDVVVKVQRKGLHRNLEVNVPLEVGNFNSAEDTSDEGDAPPSYTSLGLSKQ